MQCVRHSRYRSDAPLCSPSRRAYALVMLLQPTYYTADMVRALPDDGNRYELVWGELLVSPSPRRVHQRVVGRIFVLLSAYCTEWGAAEAVISPSDISWGNDSLADLGKVSPARSNLGQPIATRQEACVTRPAA